MREKRNVPYDVSAEAGVLCSLIRHPEFELEAEHLQPRFFYYTENADVYSAIKTLVQKGVTCIDEITLYNQLSMSTDIDKLFNGEARKKIKEMVDNSSYVARNTKEEYKVLVDIIVGLSFKRHSIHKLEEILSECEKCKIDDIDEINSKLMDTANNMASDFITTDKVDFFSKKVDALYETLVSMRNEKGFGFMPKWKCLQEYFTFQPSELVVFCARRKAGKSVIGLNLCYDLCKSGIAVVYMDTELSDLTFMTRLCSHISGIPEYKIKNGYLTIEEQRLLDDTIVEVKSLPLIHEYRSSFTKDYIITQTKILHNQQKCDFLIFDYIKSTDGKVKSASELSQELGIMTNVLKNEVAGRLNIPVVSFAQLNRQNQIGESDKLEQYSSTGVLFARKTAEEIMRDGQGAGNAKMVVMFNRNGKCHDIEDELDYLDFNFRGDCLTIDETKEQHLKEETPFEQ